jgi:hypothetical protein
VTPVNQPLDLGAGDALLHVFHGSPRSNSEDTLASTPLVRQRDAERRAAQARNSRHVAAMIRRDQRDAERRDMVVRRLNEILVPGVDLAEAILKIRKTEPAPARGNSATGSGR